MRAVSILTHLTRRLFRTLLPIPRYLRCIQCPRLDQATAALFNECSLYCRTSGRLPKSLTLLTQVSSLPASLPLSSLFNGNFSSYLSQVTLMSFDFRHHPEEGRGGEVAHPLRQPINSAARRRRYIFCDCPLIANRDRLITTLSRGNYRFIQKRATVVAEEEVNLGH